MSRLLVELIQLESLYSSSLASPKPAQQLLVWEAAAFLETSVPRSLSPNNHRHQNLQNKMGRLKKNAHLQKSAVIWIHETFSWWYPIFLPNSIVFDPLFFQSTLLLIVLRPLHRHCHNTLSYDAPSPLSNFRHPCSIAESK
ncbi:hypothetical protein Droror1_Dr00014389 [Drosera rotundifolia]